MKANFFTFHGDFLISAILRQMRRFGKIMFLVYNQMQKMTPLASMAENRVARRGQPRGGGKIYSLQKRSGRDERIMP